MCDVAYQALSQLVQQWEGPGDEANEAHQKMALDLGLVTLFLED